MAWSWSAAKRLLEHAFGFSSDSLHVLAGVLLLVATELLLRKPVCSGIRGSGCSRLLSQTSSPICGWISGLIAPGNMAKRSRACC